MKFDLVLAYCTFPDESSAQQICEVLVIEDLVACANIWGPMRSLYKWKGQLAKEIEWVAILKTAARKQGPLKERIRTMHPYSCPALVFVKIDDGLPEFMKWIYSQSF